MPVEIEMISPDTIAENIENVILIEGSDLVSAHGDTTVAIAGVTATAEVLNGSLIKVTLTTPPGSAGAGVGVVITRGDGTVVTTAIDIVTPRTGANVLPWFDRSISRDITMQVHVGRIDIDDLLRRLDIGNDPDLLKAESAKFKVDVIAFVNPVITGLCAAAINELADHITPFETLRINRGAAGATNTVGDIAAAFNTEFRITANQV